MCVCMYGWMWVWPQLKVALSNATIATVKSPFWLLNSKRRKGARYNHWLLWFDSLCITVQAKPLNWNSTVFCFDTVFVCSTKGDFKGGLLVDVAINIMVGRALPSKWQCKTLIRKQTKTKKTVFITFLFQTVHSKFDSVWKYRTKATTYVTGVSAALDSSGLWDGNWEYIKWDKSEIFDKIQFINETSSSYERRDTHSMSQALRIVK